MLIEAQELVDAGPMASCPGAQKANRGGTVHADAGDTCHLPDRDGMHE